MLSFRSIPTTLLEELGETHFLISCECLLLFTNMYLKLESDGLVLGQSGMVVLIFGDYPVSSRNIFPLLCTVRFVVVYTQNKLFRNI